MKSTLDRIMASRWLAAASCLTIAGCTGVLGSEEGPAPDAPGAPGEVPGTQVPGMPVHHLTAAEYNNTVAHLLGTSLRPASFFPSSAATGFDANVGVLSGLSPALVQGYYDAAKALAEDAFSDEARRADILICEPASSADTACARDIIERFGLRAFRRPLEAAEIDRYVKKYTEARTALEMDHAAAVQHVVRILLTSPHFFLRIELGPAPAGSPGSLNGYEIASRLSYLLWSSLPDDELLDAAAGEQLLAEDGLLEQVDRMLADPRSRAFYENFFGQWLGTRALASHEADASVFPAWNDEVKGAMLEQANAYFASFTTGGRPWSEFLGAQHPKAPPLDPIYAADPQGGRAGFLTLPAFLTLSSQPERTSPTARARILLVGLFCSNLAPPANVDIPDLSAAGGDALDPQNVRKKLEKHRESPECASCHDILDPIGLSMESFDAIGAYRTTYPNGDPIDATGVFRETPFEDVYGLLPLLEQDPRLRSCPPARLFSYALRRSPTGADEDVIEAIEDRWGGGTIVELVKQVVAGDAFRRRGARGEAP